MREFELLIERGKRHFEAAAARRRFLRSAAITLIPASAVLVALFFRFRWDVFLIAAVLPLLVIPLYKKFSRSLDSHIAARWFDQEHSLSDTLSTALEFVPRQGESLIIADLADDADRRARLIKLPEPDKVENIFLLILVAIFIALFLAHLWLLLPRDTNGAALGEMQGLARDAAGNPDSEKDLRDSLDAVKKSLEASAGAGTGTSTGTGTSSSPGPGEQTGTNTGSGTNTGKSPDSGTGKGSGSGSGADPQSSTTGNSAPNAGNNAHDRAAAMARLQTAVSRADPTEALKQLGRDLSASSISAETATELSKGDAAAAAKAAGKMKNKFDKKLEAADKKSLESALQQGSENLPEATSPGLKKALEDLKNSLDKPEDAKKAAEEMGRQFEKMAKQQAAVRGMQKKIEELKQKNPGMDGKKEAQAPGKQNAGAGNKKSGGGKNAEPGKKGSDSMPGNSSSQNKGSSGNPSNNHGKGGRAGGQLTENPLERMKKQGQKPLDKNGIDPNDPFAKDKNTLASQPQGDFDYDKGPLLTDRDKKRLQTSAESMAKSREIDDFARHHRIPESFRTYLKDFFNP
ncbi:MAG: hypothetical protein HQM09_13235 [Candidatus Riflebacteria bacterium]|nr:hypothetical protein [Candidatus Riflebacteria bacterium]